MPRRSVRGKRASTSRPPSHLEVGRFYFRDEELVVLSFALPNSPQLDRLTVAEREVAQCLLEGKSTAEIAAQRRRASRTVANQVASILRKLAVGSRSELVALLGLQRATRR